MMKPNKIKFRILNKVNNRMIYNKIKNYKYKSLKRNYLDIVKL